MTKQRKQTAGHDKKTLKDQTSAGNESEETVEDGCRCKEVSKMKPAEMLRLVISDLAFWKKAKTLK